MDISIKLTQLLANQALELVTKINTNMQEKMIDPIKTWFLNKSYIIETINDQLTDLFHIDHTNHRSIMNFQINVLAELLANDCY